ncbi:MAG: transcription-repair coupling factor [Proteobacteria bacterium]|nr:transcription-repair coupling factor [Pseudomonadota bacterium]
MVDIERIKDFLKSKEHKVYFQDISQFSFALGKIRKELNSQILILAEDEKTLDNLYENLSFFSPEVFRFPILSTLPFSKSNPPAENIGERIRTAFFAKKKSGIFLATLKSLIEPVIPYEVLEENYIYLLTGEDFSYDELRQTLPLIGYQKVESVEVVGEYTIKGGLIDVFSPYHELPVRIEFFGDNIENIRFFDPLSQRTIKTVMEAYILPARDFIYKDKYKNKALERIKAYCDKEGIEKWKRDEISEKINLGIYFGGMEYLLPVIYEEKTFLADNLNNPYTITFHINDLDSQIKTIKESLQSYYESAQKDEGFVATPSDVFDIESLDNIEKMVSLKTTSFKDEKSVFFDFQDNKEIIEKKFLLQREGDKKHPVQALLEFIEDKKALFRIIIVTRSESQKEKLKEILTFYGVKDFKDIKDFQEVYSVEKGKIALIKGRLASGFRVFSEGLWFITEEEIFGFREKKKEQKTKALTSYISSIYELKEGDLAVHIDHGIGIFRGLKQLEVLGKKGEFIELEYADNSKLFIPVDKINLIQKYISSEDYVAKIDRLGDKKWQKRKTKAKEDLRKWAEEILKVEAIRKTGKGFSFPINKFNYEEFSASFEYEETEDQKRAIEEVLNDMSSEKPMDRIICGDVGFGKTEVAIRASFVAVDCGKQVALIAPTTILAEQHYNVFKNRFEPMGFRVGILSRFVDIKEQKMTVESLKKGEIDIIIGTHRLLAKDIEFKDLGLVIIDEEHKFGVVHKERLKSIKTTVDVLTLSATPIPRTLHMSLANIRDISIIASPPEGRLAIKTYVTRFSPEIIKEACEREIQRGGQVFFVHNRISSIFAIKNYLSNLMPYAKIEVAHGRMEEEYLKDIFERFKKGDFHILLSTAIIESGLDMSNVNTIIVNRADKFGLADLYQLRGRVGRSTRKAFAYFLIPSFNLITKDALKRLKALQELEELGSGFRLAVHDLEIRGAGDLIGTKQSGRINEIGLELYMQILDETIRELRYEQGVEVKIKKIETEVKLPIPSYIPENYISSTRDRLNFYKKIFAVSSADELLLIEEELRDRYGNIPEELRNFIYQKELEIELSSIGVTNLTVSGDHFTIVFDESFVPPREILNRYLKAENRARFVPPEKVYIFVKDKDFSYENIKKILQVFIQSVKIKQ